MGLKRSAESTRIPLKEAGCAVSGRTAGGNRGKRQICLTVIPFTFAFLQSKGDLFGMVHVENNGELQNSIQFDSHKSDP
jgi:hypothetical protein